MNQCLLCLAPSPFAAETTCLRPSCSARLGACLACVDRHVREFGQHAAAHTRTMLEIRHGHCWHGGVV